MFNVLRFSKIFFRHFSEYYIYYCFDIQCGVGLLFFKILWALFWLKNNLIFYFIVYFRNEGVATFNRQHNLTINKGVFFCYTLAHLSYLNNVWDQIEKKHSARRPRPLTPLEIVSVKCRNAGMNYCLGKINN